MWCSNWNYPKWYVNTFLGDAVQYAPYKPGWWNPAPDPMKCTGHSGINQPPISNRKQELCWRNGRPHFNGSMGPIASLDQRQGLDSGSNRTCSQLLYDVVKSPSWNISRSNKKRLCFNLIWLVRRACKPGRTWEKLCSNCHKKKKMGYCRSVDPVIYLSSPHTRGRGIIQHSLQWWILRIRSVLYLLIVWISSSSSRCFSSTNPTVSLIFSLSLSLFQSLSLSFSLVFTQFLILI